MANRAVIDLAKMHLLVLIWGFTAILGELISLPPIEMVGYRTALASLGLAVLIWWRKDQFRLRRKEILKIMGIGVLIAAHWIFFFAAARVSTISVCLAGMATTSLWTSFTEPMILKRKIFLHEVLLGLLIIGGLYVIFHFEFNHALGLVFAMISAFLASLFSVMNSKITNSYGHNLITFYEMLGATLAIIIFLPIYSYGLAGSSPQLIPEPEDWLWLFLLAGVCTVYAYAQWVELMKRITAFASNLIINMEPIYGIILAVIIFGDEEKMDPGFYLGTAIIMLAVFLYPVINRLFKKRKKIKNQAV